MFSQQQQQQQQQRGLLQRQMTAPGRGTSPRGPQSPYATGTPDPLLVSPHNQKLSPNQRPSQQQQQQQQQQQISPPFSQAGMNIGPNMAANYPMTSTIASQTMTSGGTMQQYEQNLAFNNMEQNMSNNFTNGPSNGGVTQAMGYGNIPEQYSSKGSMPPMNQMMYNNTVPGQNDYLKQQMSQPNTANTPNMGSNTSQYVKQELRNICTARSQNQQQTQDLMQNFDSDDLAIDFLYQLDEFNAGMANSEMDCTDSMVQMSQQQKQQQSQQQSSQNNHQAIAQARQEARQRYERFRALSTNSAEAFHSPPVPVVPQKPHFTPQPTHELEDPKIKAATLFRNQLLSRKDQAMAEKKNPVKMGTLSKIDTSASHVQVLQTEPRTPVEDIRPADQRNSLLQQLLSE